jgi:hypothetical protein
MRHAYGIQALVWEKLAFGEPQKSNIYLHDLSTKHNRVFTDYRNNKT